MKANSTKRKIFDAVDLLTEDTSSQMPVKTILCMTGMARQCMGLMLKVILI